MPRIGFEPMTDNPMSSAHQSACARPLKSSGQESDCGIARCAESCTTVASRRTGFAPASPGPREPTIYGPLKEPTDKRRTGNTCSTTELLRRVVPKAGLEPATTRLGGDNPILRPVENAEGWTRDGFDVSGRESNPHLLVFTRCSNAVELPSSITEAQRPIPKRTTDKERDGNPSVAQWCTV